MKYFAELISAVESSNKTTAKIDAIVHYLEIAEDKDKLWFLALFTGKRPKRPVNSNFLKEWAYEITGLPEWLFMESYSSVGDLGETLSLILPAPQEIIEKPLHQWMDELIQLKTASDEEKKEYVLESWNGLDYTERFIFQTNFWALPILNAFAVMAIGPKYKAITAQVSIQLTSPASAYRTLRKYVTPINPIRLQASV